MPNKSAHVRLNIVLAKAVDSREMTKLFHSTKMRGTAPNFYRCKSPLSLVDSLGPTGLIGVLSVESHLR